MTADISYEFAFGSYEDALQMVGVRTEPRFAGTAVSAARIQHFAAMVRDGNPSYWDDDFAASGLGWSGGAAGAADGSGDPAALAADRCTARGVDRYSGSAAGHRVHQRGQ